MLLRLVSCKNAWFNVSSAFQSSRYAYRAFYVIAVAEMVVNIAVASQWDVVSFKGTHLTERMSLLTLYIRKFSFSCFIYCICNPSTDLFQLVKA